MKLDQLKNQLDMSIDSFETHVVNTVNDFHKLDDEQRVYALPETLDEICRHAFYTFQGFRDEIIQYLEEEQKRK